MSACRTFCVICLRSDKKIRRIPPVLSEYHDEITDFLIEVMNPKYCCECEYFLRKTYNFHKRCKASANMLNKWMRMKGKSRSPIDKLHLQLPSLNLSVWTPENTKVLTYKYPEDPEQIEIKEEIVEENVHDESLFKMEVHCESDQATSVLESILHSYSEVDKTEVIIENRLTIDNTIPNDTTTERVLNNASEINDLPKLTNTNVDKLKVLNTSAIKRNPLHIYAEIEPSERNTKEDNTYKIIEMPNSNDTKIFTNVSEIANDMPILMTILSNDKPTTSNTENQITHEENDEEDLVCLNDEQIDDVILLEDDDDDDYEMPDDASLNSDDDCDDYLRPPSPPHKKPKVKMTLDEIANITLSDDDFDENYLRDIQKTTKTSKKSQSLDKTLLVEKEIEEKIQKINESLKNLCENWEIPCLLETGVPNVTNDDIKEVTRQILVEKKPAVNQRGVQSMLTHMSSDLDTINEQCSKIVEDYKIGQQDPKERIKVELRKKFEVWGEVTTEYGFKLDKDIILNCIDLTNEATLRILLRRLRDTTKLDPSVARILKNIQNKHSDTQYTTVFNIEYMTTEKEMMEEFERRKTYECYVTSDYKCEICFLGFKFKRLLDYHNKSHDVSVGNLECKICHIRFPSKQAWKRHEVHYAVYRCKMCPLVTYYRASMINHFEQHSGTVYKCELCNHTMKSRSVYTQHQTSMHPRGVNVCTFCGGVFISPLGLKHHLTKKHKGEVSIESSEGLKCDKCSLTFPSQEAFDKHDKLLHGVQQTAYKKRGSPRVLRPRRKPIMTCRVCNAVGHSYGWLTNHLNVEHPDVNKDLLYADKQKYLCDVCGKGFSHKYTLRDHMDIHSGITYPCEKCPKRYPSRASLRTHEMIHNPAGFCCEQCGRKFNSKSNLYNHMRSHIGDRRFKCNICGKGFLHRCSLNIHIRGVHNHIRRIRKRGQRFTETDEHGASEIGGQEVSEPGVQEFSEIGLQGVTEAGVQRVSETGGGGDSKLGI